ncbi:hypothetical protein H4R34_004188 [Dimargaris verticillata]|uniref:Uncharacterized protein n=1 Tax=Dimargaris verticillata TaxID=2761393 RepID=A0A9W8B106_9FUNG|nr:hypothetical protein H4R34_004188 [Dimargaris verticillata]
MHLRPPCRPTERSRSRPEPATAYQGDSDDSIAAADTLTFTTCQPPVTPLPRSKPSTSVLARKADAGRVPRRFHPRRTRKPANLPPQIPPYRRAAPQTPVRPVKPVRTNRRSELPFDQFWASVSTLDPSTAFYQLPLERSRLDAVDIGNPFDLDTMTHCCDDGPWSLGLSANAASDIPLETFAYKESPTEPQGLHFDHRANGYPAWFTARHAWSFTGGTQSLTATDPLDPDMAAYYALMRSRMPSYQVLSNARLVLSRETLSGARAATLLYNHDVLNNRCLFSLLDPRSALQFHDGYIADESSQGADLLSMSLSPRTVVSEPYSPVLESESDLLDEGLGPTSLMLSETDDPTDHHPPASPRRLARLPSLGALNLNANFYRSKAFFSRCLSPTTDLTRPLSPPDTEPDLLFADDNNLLSVDDRALFGTSPPDSIDDSVTTVVESSPLMVDLYHVCWPVDGASTPDELDYIAQWGWDPMRPETKPRMTRFNSSCWRMMAIENRMIKAEKIVAPLKKRLYLPRRRDQGV